MFHEDRELVTELKQSDAHFAKLFNEHNALDAEISQLEGDPVASHRHDEIEELKRKKLHLKDELYAILEQNKK